MIYAIELESAGTQPALYVAVWSGDPGRTYVLNTARLYGNKDAAKRGLARVRRYRPFPNAKIVPVQIVRVEEPTP